MRDEHIWTEGPFDRDEINWGFRGLQGGNPFRTDYKCKISSENDYRSFVD